jgi:methionyl-tRNA synthetase
MTVYREAYEKCMRDGEYSRAIEAVSGGVGAIDRAITGFAPWKVAAAQEDDLLDEILYAATESIRILTLLLYPFIPEAASKVWQQLGLGKFKDGKSEKWAPGEYEQLLQWGGLKPGTRLGELGPIFPRADKDAIKKMQEPAPEALAPAAPSAAPAPSPSEIIGIDDFAKVELRVAQIKVAERIPKADKLLRLEVDLGYETRQILSGIAEYYTPESLVGRKIVIIANLAPRKMRGLESNGMLLAASLGEGDKPVLAGFLEDVPLGARLK